MASITLDFEAGQIAPDLEPDLDDLGRINTVVVARHNGSQFTDTDTSGPLGTTTIGVYRSQVDINPESDSVLPQHAHYHLVLGTDPDPRYPQVTVQLTARPAAAGPYVSDSFDDRTATNAWDEPEVGEGTWAVTPTAAQFDVTDGQGLVAVNAVNTDFYALIGKAANVDLTASFSTDALALGGDQRAYLIARYIDSNNFYRAGVNIGTSQVMTLFITKLVGGATTALTNFVTPVEHAADRRYMLRFQANGTTLRAKLWPETSREPVAWMATTTDASLTASGSFGTRCFLESTNTNPLPVIFAWDNFEAVDPTAERNLVAEAAAIDVGDLIRLENIPQDLGQPTADLLCLGYTEVIGNDTRTITFNTRPGAILTNVGQLDDDYTSCLQTSGAELDAAITAEQVSFAVATTSGPVFTTSPPTGAQILVGGREVMTVTAVSGGSSPQTFTVTRDPDQRMAHADASEVRVYRPLRLIL